MSYQNILSEETKKIKTKVLIFGGVSLFIGITQKLPTKFPLIEFDFNGIEKILGWFILVITVFLLIHFVTLAVLNIWNYHKNYFISKDAKNLTGDTLNMNYNEIEQECNKQLNSSDVSSESQIGTLSGEMDDIKRKIKDLTDKFDKKHITFSNIIEIIFNLVFPFILAILGTMYLFCFLIP